MSDMSDSFNIYYMTVGDFENFLSGLTDTGKSVFRSYFQRGTYGNESVMFAIDDDAFQDWLWEDEVDYDGDGSTDQLLDWIPKICGSATVMVVSGMIGGDPILK